MFLLFEAPRAGPSCCPEIAGCRKMFYVEERLENDLRRTRMTNAETPARQRRPKEETARLGDETYRRDVKAQVEADHDGEYVAIDVDSGDWAVAGSELAASDSLRAQCPDAINVWLLRVGYRAVASIGGGSLRRAE